MQKSLPILTKDFFLQRKGIFKQACTLYVITILVGTISEGCLHANFHTFLYQKINAYQGSFSLFGYVWFLVTSLLIRRELVLCEKSHYHTAIILGMFALPLSNVSNDFLYKIKDFFLRGADQTKVSSKVSLTRVDMDNRQISRCVVFLFVWVRAFPSCKIPEAY